MVQIFLSTIHTIVNDPTVNLVSILAIILLCVLLVAKEVTRTVQPEGQRQWVQKLDILIIPLVVGFGLIIAARFLSLFYTG